MSPAGVKGRQMRVSGAPGGESSPPADDLALLVSGCVKGDARAWRRLWPLATGFLSRAFARLGVPRTEMDDCIQDAMVDLCRNLGAFDGRVRLTTWLFGFARNVALERRRRLVRDDRRTRAYVDERGGQSGNGNVRDPASTCEARRDLGRLMALVDALPVPQGDAWVLCRVAGLPAGQVARTLGVSAACVRKRVSRAEKTLAARVHLRPAGPGAPTEPGIG